MVIEHTERHLDGAKPRPATVRLIPWDVTSAVTVTLIERDSGATGYQTGHEVYLDDTWLGTVSPYEGSLDRQTPIGGRYLSVPGKRRTLWSSQVPGSDRAEYRHTSRAEAIRTLAEHAGLDTA